MPRVAAEHLLARRQQILSAAETCFSRSGFHKTTMQDIILESELSAGAIYNYFKSKDEIIESIAQERHFSEREAFRAAETHSELPEAIKTLAKLFTDDLLTAQGQQSRRVSVLAWAEALLNPRVAESVLEGLDGPLVALAEAIKQHKLDSGLDPEAVSRMLIAMFHGFVLQMLWDDKTPHQEMMKVFEHLVNTLATPPS